jgi:DNA-directed RNA polymerase I, II, and III subunit RPABC2
MPFKNPTNKSNKKKSKKSNINNTYNSNNINKSNESEIFGGAAPRDVDEADNLSEDEMISNTEEENLETTIDDIDNMDEVDDDDNLGDDGNEIEDEDVDVNDKDEPTYDEIDEEEDNDACLYKFTKQHQKEDELFDDDVEEIYFFEEDKISNAGFVPDEERISKPFMSKYERVRLLGDRTRQLSLGAKPMIKDIENLSPQEVATLEIKQHMLPLIVGRTLPNGTKEKWKVQELIVLN